MTLALGIDIGSTATKAVVLDGGQIAHTVLCPTGFSSVDAAARVADELASRGVDVGSCTTVATGYGRIAVPYASRELTEITCHAKGAAHLFGQDGLIIDIGGQDTKVISLRAGKVVKFIMNDKCSAGTGKFLEVMANRLGVSHDELAELARRGAPTTISSMCTVFAESEVISLIGTGTPREDIARGVVDSVVQRVVTLVPAKRAQECFLTGGFCENSYLIERLSEQLKAPVHTNPQARYAGALGAALSAAEDVAAGDGAGEGEGAALRDMHLHRQSLGFASRQPGQAQVPAANNEAGEGRAQ